MRKLALIFGTPIFIALLLGVVYWKYFRGVWPAVLEPKEDITVLIEKSEKPPVKTPADTAEPLGKAVETQDPASKAEEKHEIEKEPTDEPKEIKKDENTTGMPLKMPQGFSISIFSKGFTKPRVLIKDPDGNLLISDTGAGKVYALPDKDKDGKADSKQVVAENLNSPHGMAFKCNTDCKLYIAESGQVAVYDYDKSTFKASNKKKLAELPSGGRHFTRTLLFRPPPDDEQLLVSIGSSCDTCLEKDKRRASVWVLDVNTNIFKPFATGLRNSVFMANHPITGETWATEMGRDFLGDDLPPDEINILTYANTYGWPYCYGKNVHDTVFDKKSQKSPCEKPFIMPSYLDIPAHSAPLGLSFFPKTGWDQSFNTDLLVAYHGSWNRSIPTGYKIVRYRLDKRGNYRGVEDFISGWLKSNGTALGRPVDILIGDDKAIYISDDKAGVIYKVTYNK